MADSSSPAIMRRRLMTELRKARAQTKLTQRDVADALDWSPSKLLRIENGNVSVSKTDLEALLRHYGIKDRRRIDELTKLAQAARKQPANRYQGVLQPELAKFYDLRSAAIRIRVFELAIIPSLLQTADYAAEILRNALPDPSDETVRRRVGVRVEQHEEIFEREDRPEMFFVLDEAVLRRPIGGPKVMRQQLEHLKLLAGVPGVTIQVIPFSVGGHRGMTGPFQIIEFEPSEDYLLYFENSRGDIMIRETSEETIRYIERFWSLEEQATEKWQLNDLIDGVIESFTPATVENDTRTPPPASEAAKR